MRIRRSCNGELLVWSGGGFTRCWGAGGRLRGKIAEEIEVALPHVRQHELAKGLVMRV